MAVTLYTEEDMRRAFNAGSRFGESMYNFEGSDLFFSRVTDDFLMEEGVADPREDPKPDFEDWLAEKFNKEGE